MTSNAALPAVHRLFDAINTGTLDVIGDLVTDDFIDHGSPVPVPPGPVGYTQILGFVTRVLNVSYQINEIICTDDRIVVRAVGNGTAVAAVHGPDVAGRPYQMDTVHIYRTEGDRLAEHWGVRDELGALIHLGVLPAPQLDLAVAPAAGSAG
jgi:predicted ester cyclase